ncbi:MAG TPA: cache domain-containing protein [Dissulfurispiraceae bacterium]|nr:cache domain-containing protein [Dissulfurispiraceae bacterium]
MKIKFRDLISFGNLPLFWKISFMPILAVGLVIVGGFFYILPLMKQKLIEDKRSYAENVVQVAYYFVADFDKRAAAGEMSLEEAQRHALESIKRIKFDKGEGYLWINDTSRMMIMHPQNTELNGTDLSGVKDPGGKEIFVEIVNLCERSGSGFVEYQWPKPGESNPQPKISFVQLYKPWGWIIGSGVYVDDVMKTVWRIIIGIGILLIIVSIVVTTTTFIVGGGFISGPIERYAKMMRGFSDALAAGKGDLTGRLDIKSKDEIGMLAVTINNVLDSYGMMVDYLKNALDIIVVLDSDGKVLYECPSCEKIFGYESQDLNGASIFDFIHPDDTAILKESIGYILERRDPGHSMEFRFLHHDGSWRVIEAVGRFFASENSVSIIINARDITERKQAAAALRESKEKISLVLDSTFEGIYGVDLNGNCTFCNPSGIKMLGYNYENDLIGKNMHELIHRKRDFPKEGYPAHEEMVIGQNIHKDKVLLWRADGTSFQAELWAHPIFKDGCLIGDVTTFIDITDRITLEKQLLRAQKMEAVGQLAGGIAHDFNNILTALMGYCSLVQMKTKEEVTKTRIEQILGLADKAANLTKSLLTFSRKQVINPQLADLNEIVSSIGKLLRPLIGDDILLRTLLLHDELNVIIDKGQIEQVFMNLATNARDAMPHGGMLTITTEAVEIDKEFIEAQDYGEVNDYAVVSVSDTGTGIDDAVRDRIFEPFFTTKEVGKGTGLGLAMVYGIVKQHGGYINVDSKPKSGTTFKIYLPLAKSVKEESIKYCGN